ncbi:endonuclease Q family protein [Geomesophilobacter sediminis]|uniref:DNA helicase UvrD n=1 Tax=Geomesophilobacter sediminis TaxID=2798584 RepID=A0A8J7M192_9BACT|nr:endonuclease Q family protein [Geomesophilobacter sediminis]MBJ6726769.1 DNA helicase UvrD [Geomesophilobacter sediminis]
MRLIADLHIHSPYSLATSADLTPANLWRWGQLKGIALLGTGDFTHPAWLEQLKSALEPGPGKLLSLRSNPCPTDVPERCRAEVSFLLSAEVCCIYRKGGRTRKVHALIHAPDFAAAERLNASLSPFGSLTANGRPILKLDAKDLLQRVLDASPEALLIPAHAWTPHFSIFGAATGFGSLEECFEELTPHVYAIETGLSSDPAMNRRLTGLDGITLVSNSDAHSPIKLGREATVFETDLSYAAVYEAIRTGNGVASTLEFFPEQGKYHADGHRPCGVRLTPAETVANGYRCPGCGGKITVGVLHRIELLADREDGKTAKGNAAFHSVIPLLDLAAACLGVECSSRKALRCYLHLLEQVGNEFHVLLEAPLEEIARHSSERLAQAIGRMRSGQVDIEAGYDGVFGKVSVL